jgi:hypothetical protein
MLSNLTSMNRAQEVILLCTLVLEAMLLSAVVHDDDAQ